MFISKNALIAPLAAAGLWLAPLSHAAAGDDYVPPVTDAVVIKECGACHMTFQPAFLPARSWEKMMAGLKDHFGENAELDEAKVKHITAYLTSNAGKGGMGLSASETPLRVSELTWFKVKHAKKGRTSPETMKRRGAKSVAGCVACHRDAAKGYYEDD
jgi:hypothetical protein